MKTKPDPDADPVAGPWFVMEEIERSHPLMVCPPMKGFADMRQMGLDFGVGQSLLEEKNGVDRLILPREGFTAAGKKVMDKLLAEPDWGVSFNRHLLDLSDRLFQESDALFALDVKQMTGNELAAWYETLRELQFRQHSSGLVWVVLEFDHQLFTRYMMEHLSGAIKRKGLPVSAAECFSVLTTPTQDSFAQKEEKSLLEIASQIQDSRIRKLFESTDLALIAERFAKMDPVASIQLDAHVERFAWLPYMYEGPAWKKSYFIQVLQGLVKHDVATLLARAEKRHTETKSRQSELLAQLQLDEKHRKLLQVAQGMVYTKSHRKDALYHYFYCMEPFLKETAKRLGLTLRQVRRFMPWELGPALILGKADLDELNRRWEHFVYHAHDGKEEVITGAEADAFMKNLDIEKPPASIDLRELSGDCACPGFAKGIVCRVERPADMQKMRKGDVLVAHATNPDIVPAMKIASAIITDMGGITCHAAIVSRELKIPCVIGTKVATQVLKDGEAVEVDATHGRVTKIG